MKQFDSVIPCHIREGYDTMTIKVCSTCKKELPISSFYRSGYTRSGKIRYANECKDCRKHREKIRYDSKQLDLLAYKRQCVHCGVNKPYLLEFHHRDPSAKEFTIAHWRKHSRDDLLTEIQECDTLCKNCHAEFHFLARTFGITYKEYLDNY